MPPIPGQVAIERAIDVSFADRATPVGYKVGNPRIAPRDNLTGELYWQARGPHDKDFTVFVHLLAPASLVAQHGAQPWDGGKLTALWPAGDQVIHPFDAAIPTTTPEAAVD